MDNWKCLTHFVVFMPSMINNMTEKFTVMIRKLMKNVVEIKVKWLHLGVHHLFSNEPFCSPFDDSSFDLLSFHSALVWIKRQLVERI